MNRRVLVAEGAGAPVGVADLLGPAFDVKAVTRGEDALALCEERGPFAAIVAADNLEDMQGVAFLSRVKRGWPDTIRVLVARTSTLDVAIQALHEGAIFRFLRRPLDQVQLRDAIESGLEHYRQVEAERLFTEQLQFSRESLLTLAESLERRLADQMARVQGLQEFSFQLNETHSLGEVARLAAESTSRMLGGRGVSVMLDVSRDASVLTTSGPKLTAETHTQKIATADGELGHLQVDLRSPAGVELRTTDLESLAALAASTAIAARNQVHRRERDDAQHATIFALAGLAEYRDDETGKHLERVAEYCRLIALGLRADGHHRDVITDAFVDDIVLSSPLHDIGKVGIPDSILFKPARLTEEEWEVMRRHPTIGAETLLGALESTGERSFLRMGHEIAWCHHEKWDGSGYPRGLAGEEIPLAARIMSVADCYDALTTWRPYKDPWSHEDAIKYVREQQGSHFDPLVAAAFLRRHAQADTIRRRLADEAQSASPAA